MFVGLHGYKSSAHALPRCCLLPTSMFLPQKYSLSAPVCGKGLHPFCPRFVPQKGQIRRPPCMAPRISPGSRRGRAARGVAANAHGQE